KAAGAGKSQFYHYFGSKDLMVRALIAQRSNSSVWFQAERLDRIQVLVEFERWFDELIQDFNEGPLACGCPLGNIGAELGSQNELLREAAEFGLMTWQRNLAAVFVRLKAAGEICPTTNPD